MKKETEEIKGRYNVTATPSKVRKAKKIFKSHKTIKSLSGLLDKSLDDLIVGIRK